MRCGKRRDANRPEIEALPENRPTELPEASDRLTLGNRWEIGTRQNLLQRKAGWASVPDHWCRKSKCPALPDPAPPAQRGRRGGALDAAAAAPRRRTAPIGPGCPVRLHPVSGRYRHRQGRRAVAQRPAQGPDAVSRRVGSARSRSRLATRPPTATRRRLRRLLFTYEESPAQNAGDLHFAVQLERNPLLLRSHVQQTLPSRQPSPSRTSWRSRSQSRLDLEEW